MPNNINDRFFMRLFVNGFSFYFLAINMHISNFNTFNEMKVENVKSLQSKVPKSRKKKKKKKRKAKELGSLRGYKCKMTYRMWMNVIAWKPILDI